MISPYKILGIEKNATKQEIRAAYKKNAQFFHPDKHPGNETAKDQFQAVKEAFDILYDDEKREEYDNTGNVTKKKTLLDTARDNIAAVFTNMFTPPPGVQALKMLHEMRFSDLIAKVKEYIDNEKARLQETIITVNDELDELENLQGRMKSTGELNMFESILHQRIENTKRNIADIENGIKVADLMMEIISEYDWEYDVMQTSGSSDAADTLRHMKHGLGHRRF